MEKITYDAILKAGGFAYVADKLNLSRQAVYQWAQVPIGHVHKVAKLSGVSVERLRPDVFKGG